MADYEETTGLSEEKILAEARRRIKLADEAESANRQAALEDLAFREGDQWPQSIAKDRTSRERPCLTINRIPAFLRQVTNEQRQDRHGVKISAVDNFADKEVAEILQGINRHIEVNSDADIAYDTAYDHAVTMGWGYVRVTTEYIEDDSFDQEIKIQPVVNPFSVYFDPASKRVDGSDASFAFVVEDIPKDEFTHRFPRASKEDMELWAGTGNHRSEGWVSQNTYRVAEYWCVKRKRRRLVSLDDGTGNPGPPTYWDEIPDREDAPRADLEILQERWVEEKRVHWYLMTATEILDQGDWPGKWIPIVPVVGEESFVNGKRKRWGMVKDVKDSQRMYNYWTSAQTEMIALAPKAPHIGAAGAFKGLEQQWATANIDNKPYLEYNPVETPTGQVAPPPQRQTFEPPVAAITNARALAGEDMKAVMGLFDASLGAAGPEQSGKAIAARQREGDTSTYHFPANLYRSIRQVGRITLDLVQAIYDVPRVMRIIGADEQQKTVQLVNDPNQPPVQHQEIQPGVIEKIFNLGIGKYDVTISAGPSYMTKRQQTAEAMSRLVEAYPGIMEKAGDLVVTAMEMPEADKLSERLKPPGMVGPDGTPIPPQVQQQMQQLQQQLAEAQQQIQQMNQVIMAERQQLDAKREIEMMKLEHQRQIEAMKQNTELVKAEMKSATESNKAAIKAELDAFQRRLEVMMRPPQPPQPGASPM